MLLMASSVTMLREYDTDCSHVSIGTLEGPDTTVDFVHETPFEASLGTYVIDGGWGTDKEALEVPRHRCAELGYSAIVPLHRHGNGWHPIRQNALDIELVVGEVATDDKVHLVGQSRGGPTALLAALYIASSVESLTFQQPAKLTPVFMMPLGTIATGIQEAVHLIHDPKHELKVLLDGVITQGRRAGVYSSEAIKLMTGVPVHAWVKRLKGLETHPDMYVVAALGDKLFPVNALRAFAARFGAEFAVYDGPRPTHTVFSHEPAVTDLMVGLHTAAKQLATS